MQKSPEIQLLTELVQELENIQQEGSSDEESVYVSGFINSDLLQRCYNVVMQADIKEKGHA